MMRRTIIFFLFFFLVGMAGGNLYAADYEYDYDSELEESPQWWTTELKGGFWMPSNSTMKRFFDPCCNMVGMVEQGFLYQEKYGAELGVGFMSIDGTALGATSGTPSEDKFNLFLLPIETSFVFRADFVNEQVLVPYAKFGFDYVFFRQNLKGNVTKGLKGGLHGVAGIQILLDSLAATGGGSLDDMGINDVYWTLEARYSWINNFGAKGLDLSGWLFMFGLMFAY